ncbi:orotate phosphoribosyltransferase [Candidatus Curtissbacteria bacterium]|nr:orotate phosphoribosyltransferase [Candidatus Curtissbacteria bacterium]
MKSTSIDKTASFASSILIDIGAVIFRPKQPFEYKSGILSPIYTDNRLIVSYPVKWNKIINFLAEKINKIEKPDVIAGVATAGVPHAALLANKLKMPLVYARPTPKGHGLDKLVEGVLKRGQRVCVIDDLVSTGLSSLSVVDSIRKLGGKVTDQLTIFSYDLPETQKNYKDHKVKLHPLTNLAQTVEVARKKGFLKPEQVDIVLDWARDPHNWAKRQGFR